MIDYLRYKISMFTFHEIRQKYLKFFEKQGHVIIPSASLIPENDPSTLFTGSGMQPLVPYLLGEKHPAGSRLTDSQKCFRSKDIEEVGDNRHTTCFEMLGNWSLGDYFKKEQIPWIFSFVADELGLDLNRIFVTVFRGNESIGVPRDTESAHIWQEEFRKRNISADIVDYSEVNGLQGGRIFYFDEAKNWWSRSGIPTNMPLGELGGPDSEMFWDFGEEQGFHERWANEMLETFPHVREGRSKQRCHVNCDCGRFMEIGNSVFMQYKRTERGFEELPQKNVDFGGGLERLAAASIDNSDMFRIDLFAPIIHAIESMSKIAYDESDEVRRSYRIILDHLKAATFLIGDGVIPGNKDQGYFVRRLIRRAVRYAEKIGIHESFCGNIAHKYIKIYSDVYPNLSNQERVIRDEMQKEEEKFRLTLEKGLKEIDRLFPIFSFRKMPEGENLPILNKVDPEKVFLIYQSFGFPLELISEELARRAMMFDELEVQEQYKKHQELSRTGSEQKFAGGLSDHSEANVKGHTATHLLHQALRTVLGNHVFQKGSNITPERIRFDFSHPQKVTAEELRAVEDLVKEQIRRSLPVSFEILSVQEAKDCGAVGVFEEKYGEQVKVYSVGDFSKEICGGPHVNNTAELKNFRILKEEAVSSGVRRIKAVVE
jgi:alanyl-tRNA synthetase